MQIRVDMEVNQTGGVEAGGTTDDTVHIGALREDEVRMCAASCAPYAVRLEVTIHLAVSSQSSGHGRRRAAAGRTTRTLTLSESKPELAV